ncbi:MBL fold metallo-hydrolase [Ornithinimicrobium humiphilum]|uniref:Ribonuclease BN (tRNA processing enzyme) n=1 Tax=Ornithinimicrobium humiphilum TaxID=125288 RepID=A0A543KLT7_9MICO|nr:MBL fold metallo-hydrolase [Ornithinimicrobium humiphilum]TQM96036.1 ribonuclease BN (tRNA processing enzyme) [Ornithinimicrobium humiphilum]
MDLTIVGCSGSLAGPESPASCYLVRAQAEGRKWQVLLDLGSGALGALQRHTDPMSLDAVILSHLHPDHCLDMTGLRVMRQHGPRPATEDLVVYGPGNTGERLARAYGVDEPDPMAGMRFVALEDGVPVTIGPFSVTPYSVRHPVPTFGLRIAADGVVLAFTGDTDTCPGLEPLMHEADLVLSEASYLEGRDTGRGVHLTAHRAATAARDAGARRLMLTHLPPWTSAEDAVAEASQVWHGEVEVARPGLTVTV